MVLKTLCRSLIYGQITRFPRVKQITHSHCLTERRSRRKTMKTSCYPISSNALPTILKNDMTTLLTRNW